MKLLPHMNTVLTEETVLGDLQMSVITHFSYTATKARYESLKAILFLTGIAWLSVRSTSDCKHQSAPTTIAL